MKLEAAVIQGDGVGPEMMEEAVRVLQAVCRRKRTSSTGKFKNLYPGSGCLIWKFRSEKIPGLAVG
mgnify:CR=1 FL=1